MRYLSIILLCFFSSCYGFKGISIPPDINTFYVEDFENRAPNAPGGINQTFSETLRTKIRNESKLTLVDRDADITFAGPPQLSKPLETDTKSSQRHDAE